MISWALVHGLVMLARDGALSGPADTTTPTDVAEAARRLAQTFAERITS